MATTPAVTAIGAVLLLRDRITGWKAAGLAVAVAGVVAVNLGGPSSGSGDNVWLGSLLVFGAVCCEATYTLLGKKLTANLSPQTIAVWAAAGAALLFAPFAVVQAIDFDWSRPAATDWLALLWWGAGTMGLGSLLWFGGVMRVSGTTASGFMAVMPLSALLLSYLLVGESFAWIHVVGMAAVGTGIAAVAYSDTRRNDEREGS
ncbi:DMT family transporter [Paractinoplanes rishiriensis]|nr:DMT family transporter [Actinoplanes rishiriensis]